LEAIFARRQGSTESSAPPIFLVGPPRSGSTLVTQVLTDAFRVGYMSNLHCRWYGWPGFAERTFGAMVNKAPSDYASSHGRTRGLSAPAECGAWWYRFFPVEPAYATRRDISDRKLKAFARSLRDLEAAAGLPLIFKNLYASLRIEPIVSCFPDALFVVIEREEALNAQSILRARHKVHGCYEPWWSVPPPEVEELKRLKPVEQVVGQIRKIHDLIDGDVKRLGLADQVFRINYERFCSDVHGTLGMFEEFAATRGVALERRFDVPKHFPSVSHSGLPADLLQELDSCVRGVSD
jgi:hypothetical protein